MAQTPKLDQLIPSNKALKATWSNDPYSGINNAYLLVVDSSTNTMSYIYLTENEALEQEYTISDLTNGVTYSVRYTQVQGLPDGQSYYSNTLKATPCTVPDAPYLESIYFSGDTTATATVTFGNSNGCTIESVVFQLANETNGAITSQFFQVSSTTPTTFPLSGLIQNSTYIGSVQSINDAGFSQLSNVVLFQQNDSPAAPTTTDATSGMDSDTIIAGTVSNNSTNKIDKLEVYVAENNSLNPQWFLLGYKIITEQPNTINFNFNASSLTGFNPSSLTNGLPYLLKVRANNSIGPGLFSIPRTFVPAKKYIISNASLNVSVSTKTLIAIWEMSEGSFFPPTCSVKFLNSNGIELGNVTTSGTSATLTSSDDLLYGESYSAIIEVSTAVPRPTAQSWTQPSLAPNDEFYGTGATAYYTPTTVPGPVTNITYITSINGSGPNSGVLQSFWNAPISNGFSPITAYIVKLYGQYPNPPIAPLQIINTGVFEYGTFVGLTQFSKQYWFEVAAENANGVGPYVIYPASGPGIFIVGSIPPVQNLKAIQNNSTPLTVNLSWSAHVQPGFTINNFSVVRIDSDGTITTLPDVSYVTEQTAYSTNTTVPAFSTYTFGVVTNAVTSPGGTSVSSGRALTEISLVSAPIITMQGFTANSSGNGIVNFILNRGGSSATITNNGVMMFVLPASTATGSINPVNLLPQPTIDLINASPSPIYSVSYQLPYPIDNPTGYLVSASNEVSTTYVQANLTN